MARLAPSQRAAVDAAAIEATLRAGFEAGQAAWPTVALSAVEFAAHVGGCLAARPELGLDGFAQLGAAELYLAAACTLRRPSAIACFRARFLAEIEAPLRRVGLRGADVDELAHEVLELILVGDGDGPVIASYSGRGSLRGWVRSVTIRTASKRHRSAEQESARRDRLGEVMAQPEVDVELGHLKATYAADLEAALATALAALDPRERNLLRHYFVDGLTVDEIGRLQGVHRSTAARWVVRAREQLREAVIVLVHQRLGLSPSEVESLGRFVRSQLDLSLGAAVAVDPDQ
ncbi:MAG: sigma-70 family RNA polymerase sigma factor [Nannocystaceae bacterium]|nr:sigma-70 family RNA polymerase sigma factor [Nannocystaceae bacterium]